MVKKITQASYYKIAYALQYIEAFHFDNDLFYRKLQYFKLELAFGMANVSSCILSTKALISVTQYVSENYFCVQTHTC